MENLEKIDGPSSAYGYLWHGYSATVYKARDCDTGEIMAVKRAPYDTFHPVTSKAAMREIILLTWTEPHPNVIRLLKGYKGNSNVVSYLDYMEFNLEKFITPPCNPIPPLLRKKYLQQILSGIDHCHATGFVHRHLEPRFVLVDPLIDIVKISEFGEAVALISPNLHSGLADANIGYRAPEVLLGPRYSAATDVWAVGCIFAAMVRHKPLFNGIRPEEELLSIFSVLGRPDFSTWPQPLYESCRANIEMIFSASPVCATLDLRSLYWGSYGIEETGLDLLQRMLCLNPKDRITTEEALKHPYFYETPSDQKLRGKRKSGEISSEHDVGIECGEIMSM